MAVAGTRYDATAQVRTRLPLWALAWRPEHGQAREAAQTLPSRRLRPHGSIILPIIRQQHEGLDGQARPEGQEDGRQCMPPPQAFFEHKKHGAR